MRSAYGFDTPTGDDWRDFAACSPETAEWFWLTGDTHGRLTSDNLAALKLCASCPVVRQCDEHETAHPSPFVRIAAGKVWRRG